MWIFYKNTENTLRKERKMERKIERKIKYGFILLSFKKKEKMLEKVEKLCGPAKLYLAISVVLMVLLIIHNLTSKNNKFCVGDYSSCFNATPLNIMLFFIIKAMYIAFWTFILNLACQKGQSTLSYLLVFFPIILFILILIGLLFGPFFIYP
jgi:hypothetical protein